MDKPRIIISGGGTGGHIFPAIAIANKLKEKYPNAEIHFVGAKGRMEMEKVPQAGYSITGLWISGLQRRLTLKNLSFPFKVISSLWNARKIINKFKPDIAIGVGGYASGPLLQVAAINKVKTLVQEQNSYPGITNKILSSKVNKICVAYEGLERWFPKEKIIVTGNPVRKNVVLLEGKREKAIKFFGLDQSKKTLLVVGGSLGARSINESISQGLDKFSDIQVIWQTGKNYEADSKAETLANIHPKTFIYEMDLAYAAADFIISRAGAMAISELCIIGKPCILVPSPYVSEDHQTKNAMALVDKNAAILINDKESNEKLVDTAIKTMHNKGLCLTLSSNICKLGKPKASDSILKEIEGLLKE